MLKGQEAELKWLSRSDYEAIGEALRRVRKAKYGSSVDIDAVLTAVIAELSRGHREMSELVKAGRRAAEMRTCVSTDGQLTSSTSVRHFHRGV